MTVEPIPATGAYSASIACLNKGENLTTDMLLRICQYLNCSLPDICVIVPNDMKGETC